MFHMKQRLTGLREKYESFNNNIYIMLIVVQSERGAHLFVRANYIIEKRIK